MSFLELNVSISLTAAKSKDKEESGYSSDDMV